MVFLRPGPRATISLHMQRYAQLFARTRMPSLLFAVLATLLAALGLSRIRFDDVPRGIFAGDDAAFSRLLALYEEFGTDDGDALLVADSEDWLRPDSLAFLSEVAERVGAVEGIETVVWAGTAPIFDGGLLPRSLLEIAREDPERARSLALEHPLIGGRLLSEDGTCALVLAQLEGERISIGDIQAPVRALRQLADELDERPGVSLRVTGIPPIRCDIYDGVRGDQVRFFLIGGVLCSLTALFLFRSFGALVCTTVPPLFGAVWAYGFIGLVGVELDILSGILAMLVIVIALTDSVHLMIDVLLSRSAGAGKRESAVLAIRHLGTPCALTSLTTAVGFGSLGLASVPAIRDFGLLAAGSVVAAFLAVITVQPLLVSCFGHVGARRALGAETAWSRRAGPLVRAVLRRPLAVTIGGAAVTLGLFLLSMRLLPENRLTEALPRGTAFDALMRAEEAFGGVLPICVLVEWDPPLELTSPEVLAGFEDVATLLGEEEVLARPLSLLDFLDALPGGRDAPAAGLALLPDRALRRLVQPGLGKAIVLAAAPDAGSDVMQPLFTRLQAGLTRLQGEHPPLRFHLTGTDFVARSNINRMIDDLARSLAFAVLVIFGVIALEFRSLRLGAVSLLPNLFPLALVGGVTKLLGLPLQMAIAVLFTVLLGLAVDDTIHFLSRQRRERREDPGASEDQTLVRTFLAVGRAIGVTTVVLVVGFATVGLSNIPTNRMFAALSCLGLIGALVGDLVLLPALMRLVPGKRTGP